MTNDDNRKTSKSERDGSSLIINLNFSVTNGFYTILLNNKGLTVGFNARPSKTPLLQLSVSACDHFLSSAGTCNLSNNCPVKFGINGCRTMLATLSDSIVTSRVHCSWPCCVSSLAIIHGFRVSKKLLVKCRWPITVSTRAWKLTPS